MKESLKVYNTLIWGKDINAKIQRAVHKQPSAVKLLFLINISLNT